jgi:hypothetical protein
MRGMRSLATSVLFFIAIGLVGSQSANVVCRCIAPPGGDCTCRDNQIAVCKIRDQICKGTCYDTVASDDNRMAAARVVSNIFESTTNTIGFDREKRIFRPTLPNGDLSPVRSLLKQLVDVVADTPEPGIGYRIKFSEAERAQWVSATKVDPGTEVRFAVSNDQVPRVRAGLRELVSSGDIAALPSQDATAFVRHQR